MFPYDVVLLCVLAVLAHVLFRIGKFFWDLYSRV